MSGGDGSTNFPISDKNDDDDKRLSPFDAEIADDIAAGGVTDLRGTTADIELLLLEMLAPLLLRVMELATPLPAEKMLSRWKKRMVSSKILMGSMRQARLGSVIGVSSSRRQRFSRYSCEPLRWHSRYSAVNLKARRKIDCSDWVRLGLGHFTDEPNYRAI